MFGKYSTLKWQETMNDVTIDCSLDIAIHPAKSPVVLLTVPGVDGTVDGYENKYVRTAENVQKDNGAAVVRMANPFITSFHWESNFRRVLAYIDEHAFDIAGRDDIELRIMAHSAGAAIVAQIAWEYPHITRLLLINIATKLELDKIKLGLSDFSGEVTLLFGSDDMSVKDINELAAAGNLQKTHIVVLDGVDHNFSGEALKQFVDAPTMFLFDE
jgi:hypothetical protein